MINYITIPKTPYDTFLWIEEKAKKRKLSVSAYARLVGHYPATVLKMRKKKDDSKRDLSIFMDFYNYESTEI